MRASTSSFAELYPPSVGWNITMRNSGIKVDQSGYAKALLEEYGMEQANSVHIPLPRNVDVKPARDDERLLGLMITSYTAPSSGVSFTWQCVPYPTYPSVDPFSRAKYMHRRCVTPHFGLFVRICFHAPTKFSSSPTVILVIEESPNHRVTSSRTLRISLN